MTSGLSMTWLDHSREKSNVTVYLDALLNDGSNYGILQAARAAVESAMKDVSLCNLSHSAWNMGKQFDTPDIPASGFAQRESGLRVKLRDTVTNRYTTYTIPSPDSDSFDQPNTDLVDESNPAIIALMAVTSELRSIDGNAVVWVEGRLIGRRN